MIKCPKCNNDNNENSNFCIYCGNQLKNEIRLKDNKEDEKKSTQLLIVSIALYIGGPLITKLLNLINSIMPQNSIIPTIKNILPSFSLIAIGILIYGRVKYPNNKGIKIALIVLSTIYIITIIAGIILLIACITTCSTMDTTHCD